MARYETDINKSTFYGIMHKLFKQMTDLMKHFKMLYHICSNKSTGCLTKSFKGHLFVLVFFARINPKNCINICPDRPGQWIWVWLIILWLIISKFDGRALIGTWGRLLEWIWYMCCMHTCNRPCYLTIGLKMGSVENCEQEHTHPDSSWPVLGYSMSTPGMCTAACHGFFSF